MTLYENSNNRNEKKYLELEKPVTQETLTYFKNNFGAYFEGRCGNKNEKIIQLEEVADSIGHTPIYETLCKENELSPWTYAGQCVRGESINKNPLLMPIVYVCSRYRADTRRQLRTNIEMAKYICSVIAKEGGIPIAPHLYFTRFLDDSIEEERYYGMAAGKRLMNYCKTFYVVTIDNYISEGMKEEIKYMTEELHLKGELVNFTKDEAVKILKNRMER